MYTIFHGIFLILYVHWFLIKFSQVCTFKKFNIFYKYEWFVPLMYIIFHWIFKILYFKKENQISQQVQTICTSYVHNFPLNFHDLGRSLIFHRILMNLYNQWILIYYKSERYVHLLYTILRWIFMVLYF